MAHKIADEILKEILSPPLRVPDELFADPSAVSPFSKATYSAADVLHVCKRWMRVATPALYHTVIIRSMAQAQALAAALKRNPEFGQYIRKLRIEGAYGEYLARIGTLSPHITDFCFSLAIWADARTGGLLKLLPTLNPKRVILTTPPPTALFNKKHSQVVEKFASSIALWTNLESFTYSSTVMLYGRGNLVTELDVLPEVATALSTAPSLRSVRFWQSFSGAATTDASLAALASNAHVISFYVHGLSESYHDNSVAEILSTLPESMRSRAVPLCYSLSPETEEQDSRRDDLVSSNPFYVPMSNASEDVRSNIWSRIFRIAIANLELTPRWTLHLSWYNTDCIDYKVATSLLGTSREFSALTIPLLFEHLAVASKWPLAMLYAYMASHRIAGSTVRSLRVSAVLESSSVLPLISQTTQLQKCAVSANEGLLKLLGSTAGATLQELTLSSWIPYAAFCPAVLFPFRNLTTLRWTPVPERWADVEGTVPVDALGKLSSLIVDNGHPTRLLQVLESFELPSIAELHLPRSAPEEAVATRFMLRHGEKIKRLSIENTSNIDLQLCTALEELELRGGSTDRSFLATGHARLRKLKLSWETYDYGGGRSSLMPQEEWKYQFGRMTRARYPALQEVHLRDGENLWPTNERDIKKSPWPRHAEQLASEGITLLDHDGNIRKTNWRSEHSRPSGLSDEMCGHSESVKLCEIAQAPQASTENLRTRQNLLWEEPKSKHQAVRHVQAIQVMLSILRTNNCHTSR